jgi:ribosome-associated toxin RatA of RatAB toxin-antitoxin module
MHIETSLLMRAQPSGIYPIAATVERWPDLLPHYRYVRVLRHEGNSRLVEMAAHRDGIPVRWWAEQRLYPDLPRITFKHVRGVTAGMDVEWIFDSIEEGTLVRIIHELDPHWPLGSLIAKHIVGPFFIENIAGKTLHQIKRIVESPLAVKARE